MAAILKSFCGDNSAADCSISVKFCTGKQNSMMIEVMWCDIISKFRKFKMADGRHIVHRKIVIFQRKIIRVWWNLVHNSTYGTRWQPYDQIWTCLKFKMTDVRRFNSRFSGHNWATDCPISVKWCVVKQFFPRVDRCRRSVERIFGFSNIVWAASSGAFRIVSDTLVSDSLFVFLHCS